ncbi:hypothetical protein D3C75_1279610 [compost metagenome]
MGKRRDEHREAGKVADDVPDAGGVRGDLDAGNYLAAVRIADQGIGLKYLHAVDLLRGLKGSDEADVAQVLAAALQ